VAVFSEKAWEGEGERLKGQGIDTAQGGKDKNSSLCHGNRRYTPQWFRSTASVPKCVPSEVQ